MPEDMTALAEVLRAWNVNEGRIDSKPDGTIALTSKKVVRYVRTEDGKKWFGQPIGSIIVKDLLLKHLKMTKSKGGKTTVQGSNGESYTIEQGVTGTTWFAKKDGKTIITAPSEESVLKGLDTKVANSPKSSSQTTTKSDEPQQNSEVPKRPSPAAEKIPAKAFKEAAKSAAPVPEKTDSAQIFTKDYGPPLGVLIVSRDKDGKWWARKSIISKPKLISDSLQEKLEAEYKSGSLKPYKTPDTSPEAPQASVGKLIDVGGVQASPEEIKSAIETLKAAKGYMVKQPLAKADSPLAGMDYHNVASKHLNKQGGQDKTKVAVLKALEEMLGSKSRTTQEPDLKPITKAAQQEPDSGMKSGALGVVRAKKAPEGPRINKVKVGSYEYSIPSDHQIYQVTPGNGPAMSRSKKTGQWYSYSSTSLWAKHENEDADVFDEMVSDGDLKAVQPDQTLGGAPNFKVASASEPDPWANEAKVQVGDEAITVPAGAKLYAYSAAVEQASGHVFARDAKGNWFTFIKGEAKPLLHGLHFLESGYKSGDLKPYKSASKAPEAPSQPSTPTVKAPDAEIKFEVGGHEFSAPSGSRIFQVNGQASKYVSLPNGDWWIHAEDGSKTKLGAVAVSVVKDVPDLVDVTPANKALKPGIHFKVQSKEHHLPPGSVVYITKSNVPSAEHTVKYVKTPDGQWYGYTAYGANPLAPTVIKIADQNLANGLFVQDPDAEHVASPSSRSKVDIGGVTVSADQIQSAIQILQNSKGYMVKQPLAKQGHPLKDTNYHGVAKPHITGSASDKTKVAFLKALEEELAKLDKPAPKQTPPLASTPTPKKDQTFTVGSKEYSVPGDAKIYSDGSHPAHYVKYSDGSWQPFTTAEALAVNPAGSDLAIYFDNLLAAQKIAPARASKAEKPAGIKPGKYVAEGGAYILVNAEGYGTLYNEEGEKSGATDGLTPAGMEPLTKLYKLVEPAPQVTPAGIAAGKYKNYDGKYMIVNPDGTGEAFNEDGTSKGGLKIAGVQSMHNKYGYTAYEEGSAGVQPSNPVPKASGTKADYFLPPGTYKLGTGTDQQTLWITSTSAKISTPDGSDKTLSAAQTKALLKSYATSKGEMLVYDTNGTTAYAGAAKKVSYAGQEYNVTALQKVQKGLDKGKGWDEAWTSATGATHPLLGSEADWYGNADTKEAALKQLLSTADKEATGPQLDLSELQDPWLDMAKASKISTFYSMTSKVSVAKKFAKDLGEKSPYGGQIGIPGAIQAMGHGQVLDWIKAVYSGDMEKAYDLEYATLGGTPSAAKLNNHPGKVGPKQIKFAAAVEGEIPAGDPVSGPGMETFTQSDVAGLYSTSYLTPEQTDAYLLNAKMANPEGLTASGRKQWVHAHAKGNKWDVDQFSVQAQANVSLGKIYGEKPQVQLPLVPAGSTVVPEPEWKPFKPGASEAANLTDTQLNSYLSQVLQGAVWKDALKQDADTKKAIVQLHYLTSDHGDSEAFLTPKEAKGQWWSFVSDASAKAAVTSFYEELKIAYPTFGKKAIFTKAPDQPNLPGAQAKFVVESNYGGRYLFKTHHSDTARPYVEDAALQMAKQLGYGPPESQVAKVNGKVGHVQALIPNTGDLKGISPSDLTDQQLSDVLREHVFDWMIENGDAHSENFLTLSDGSIKGIDKGQAWQRFGRSKLARGHLTSPVTLEYGKKSYYEDVYDAIASGEIDQEKVQKAYQAVIKRARLISRADRKKYEASLDYALSNKMSLTNTAYSTKADFKAAALERLDNVEADFDKLWTKLLADAGIEKPEIKEFAPDTYVGLSGELMEAVAKGRNHGHAAFYGSKDLEDGHIMLWEHKNPDTGKGGTTKVMNARGQLRKDADSKLMAWLSQYVDTQGQAGGTAYSEPNDTGVPEFDNLNSSLNTKIVGGIKAVSQFSKQGQMDSWSTDAFAEFKAAKTDIESKLSGSLTQGEHGALFDGMLQYYLAEIDRVLTNHAEGTKPALFDKYIGKKPDPEPLVGAKLKPDPSFKVEKLGHSYYHTAKLDTDTGELTATSSTSTDGATGAGYKVTFPDGTEMIYKPHGNHNVARSQQGQFTVRVPEYSSTSQVDQVVGLLKSAGIEANESSTDADFELQYWRHLYGVQQSRADSASYPSITAAVEDKSTSPIIAGLTPAEEIVRWRALWASYYADTAQVPDDQARAHVDSWVASKAYMPRFSRKSIHDTTAGHGRPYWVRFDVSKAEYGKREPLAHAIQGDLLDVVKSGALISTEERMNVLGRSVSGMSSGPDQGHGSANFVFTRQNQLNGGGSTMVYVDPATLARTSTYSFNGDNYGDVEARSTTSHFKFSKMNHNGSSNETMIKYGVSVLDDVWLVVFPTKKQREEAIAHYKALGIDEIGGEPIERVFITNAEAKEGKKRLKEKMQEVVASA